MTSKTIPKATYPKPREAQRCHVYNKGDDSWRDRPVVMRRDTALRAIEHGEQHRLDRFSFIFHGGEPLLAGDDFLAFFVDAARRRLAPAGYRGTEAAARPAAA